MTSLAFCVFGVSVLSRLSVRMRRRYGRSRAALGHSTVTDSNVSVTEDERLQRREQCNKERATSRCRISSTAICNPPEVGSPAEECRLNTQIVALNA